MTDNHEERARQSQVAAAKETEEALQDVTSEEDPNVEADVTPQGEAQNEETPTEDQGDSETSLTDAPNAGDAGASTDEDEVSPSVTVDQSEQMDEYDQTFVNLEPGTRSEERRVGKGGGSEV